MGLTSMAMCAPFLLATLLLSATLDCARKQDTHVLLEYRCADQMWTPMVPMAQWFAVRMISV